MQGSSDSKATLGFDPDALRRKYAEERARRMRPDAAAQYQRLAGKFAQFADDPHVEPGFTREPVHEEIDVLIVGGGFSGLISAARMRHQKVESSDEYLQTFNRDNVTLVDTAGKGVERITPAGAVVAGKEYALDCLIYATGFEWLSEFASQIGFEIHGRDSLALSDRWSQGTRTMHGMHTRGFPNMFLLGLAQNGVTPNYTHLAEERAIHLAYLLKRCIRENIHTIETTKEAEDKWVEEIIGQRGPRRAFLESCTPSYYNQEGRDTPATALNDIYGAGSVAFFKVLTDWRAQDALHGLEVTRKVHSKSDERVSAEYSTQ